MKDTLQPLPGVAEVVVDFPNRIATVKSEGKSFDVQNAIAKLAENGYDKSTLIETTN